MKKQTEEKDPMLGKQVPAVSIENSQGDKVNLRDLKGKNIILYFYPKDDTPGCTLEGKEFAKLYPKFKKLNTEVFGISRDSVKSHDKFKCKYDFGFELLSDPDEKLCKAFDVIKEKNMYGKKVLGIVRSTFVIGSDGKVVGAFRKVKPEGHAQEMLDLVSEL